MVEVVLTMFSVNEGLYLRVSATPFQFPWSRNLPIPKVQPRFAEMGYDRVRTDISILPDGERSIFNLYLYSSMSMPHP